MLPEVSRLAALLPRQGGCQGEPSPCRDIRDNPHPASLITKRAKKNGSQTGPGLGTELAFSWFLKLKSELRDLWELKL